MPITIQEIIASDTISQLVDKTNFNFDQLLLNGGGPAGPVGPIGPVGPSGGRGPKGTTWYEDTATSDPGTTPTANFPTATPRTSDYYLQFNGVVWEYTGLAWSQTTIDLRGPQGIQGPGGGMGDTFGSPTIGLKTAIYNGTIGLGVGATSVNEGVPSVMIGGAVTTTQQLTGIPLTNAYVIPDSVAANLISSTAALLLHQKDATTKAIVFHGGAANSGDKFYQTDLAGLSSIRIGIDDKLIMDVPKAATSPAALGDLYGYEVNVPERSQNFLAGKAINFQTGDSSVASGFGGENSDFTVNVGTGTSAGGNKFVINTAGTSGSGLVQIGTGFSVVTETTRNATIQFQGGETNFVSSANKTIQIASGGEIRLDTTLGSNPSGKILLTSGVGGITAQTNNGDIVIKQADASSSATADINIENSSTAPNATVGGDIYIQSNSQTILKKTTATSKANSSIVIDYGYDGAAGAQPHTRFVGQQTISPAGLSTGTTPPISFGNTIYKNPTTALASSNAIFELTGNNGVVDMAPGAIMQGWSGGTQSASGVDAGLLVIGLGSEGPQQPVPAANYAWDNSLGFGVRNSGNTEDYFNASENKISFAAPWVLKRARGLNSSINSAPTSTYVPNGTAPAPINYGWNTRQTLSPQQVSPNGVVSLGMPTTADLNVPFISLNFGPGLGYKDSSTGLQFNNQGYDYKVNFPTGAYPGQRLAVKVYVQAVGIRQATKSGSGSVYEANYGSVSIRIPQFRIKSPSSVANYTSWYQAGTTTATKPGYSNWPVGTSASDAADGIGRFKVLDMIWDGQYITQQGADVDSADPNSISTTTQHGWVVTGISLNANDNNLVTVSGPDNSPGCFVAGTEIALANGDIKNIEDILSGEEVITWNESTKTAEVGTVGKLKIIEEVGMIIKLTLDNGTVLRTTEHHPFYHRDGENTGLIDAGELRPGMAVLTIDGAEANIQSVIEEHGLYTVYNLIDVSGNHNFYVNEVLVHNKAG